MSDDQLVPKIQEMSLRLVMALEGESFDVAIVALLDAGVRLVCLRDSVDSVEALGTLRGAVEAMREGEMEANRPRQPQH